jgi:hypothetical protein
LLVVVFQQQKGEKAKQVLDGVVSVMKNDEGTVDWSVFGNGKK